MTDVKKLPWMRWHPETAEVRVFHRAEDVPEGWVDQHPVNLLKPPASEPKTPKPAALSRQQIVADLRRRGVAYQPNASTKALYDLLVAEVERSEA